jgi:hypothetical protein
MCKSTYSSLEILKFAQGLKLILNRASRLEGSAEWLVDIDGDMGGEWEMDERLIGASNVNALMEISKGLDGMERYVFLFP